MIMNDMTDDGKWGAAIRVDGVKPDWLGEDCKVDVQSLPGGHWYSERASGLGVGTKHIGWRHVEYIRLPADHPYYQQTQPIDWSAPIEAVHEDGRVVRAEAGTTMGVARADYRIASVDGVLRYFDRMTGTGRYPDNPWRIRNVQPTTQTTPNLGATLTAQERLSRFEGFVKKLAAVDATDTGPHFAGNWCREARALVAEMEPVDPDEERARDLAAKLASVTLPASNPAHSGFAAAGKVNEYISRPTTEAERMIACMYRGIKEGRELARGDVA